MTVWCCLFYLSLKFYCPRDPFWCCHPGLTLNPCVLCLTSCNTHTSKRHAPQGFVTSHMLIIIPSWGCVAQWIGRWISRYHCNQLSVVQVQLHSLIIIVQIFQWMVFFDLTFLKILIFINTKPRKKFILRNSSLAKLNWGGGSNLWCTSLLQFKCDSHENPN